MSNYFSTNLKFIRNSKGMSQNKFADLLGVNQTTIARWESKEIAPSVDNVEIIADILDIPLPELLGKDMRIQDGFNKLDTAIISKAKELSDEDKLTVLRVIESINKDIDNQN